ncbi:hypothetical protein PsorP6_003100 [Peronosclerospora sorghi]|uniref:Uncharacterized protein n=1 Tax=Peronosclerospora sorghi TaxID=230839 RepID=A0ACC0VK72_9STRA|nr:hypothetical protein PsorP6_003100 [Peronosclerospora sorghi]
MTEVNALRMSFNDVVELGVRWRSCSKPVRSESEKANAFAYELAFFQLIGKYDDMNVHKFQEKVDEHKALEEDLQPFVEQLVTRYTHYFSNGRHGFNSNGDIVE